MPSAASSPHRQAVYAPDHHRGAARPTRRPPRLAPAARAESPVEVASDLVGIHATDPASVYLGAFARTRSLVRADLERALYEERVLLQVLGMRRAMFVVPVDLAGIVHAACTRAIGQAERRRIIQVLAAAGIAEDAESRLAGVEAATIRALDERGEATATSCASMLLVAITSFLRAPIVLVPYDCDRTPDGVLVTLVTTRGGRFRAMLGCIEPEPPGASRRHGWRERMAAKVGDRIVVESERVGMPAREGEILEVVEASYGTKYRVRWDDGHESTVRPSAGSATTIPRTKRRRR